MNPYQSPKSDPDLPPTFGAETGGEGREKAASRFRKFVSTSGSFSRTELFIATAVLGGVALMLGLLHGLVPDLFSWGIYRVSLYGLYPIWGMALGKRSRDLGTTFTYGMIIGMIFPVIGLLFLFQEGAKYKECKAVRARGEKDRRADKVTD